MSSQVVNDYLRLYKPMLTAITHAPSDTAAIAAATRVLDNWMKGVPGVVVRTTTGVTNEESKKNYVSAFSEQLRNPWFKNFLRYDPDPFVQKIRAKVLALNGDKDIQVVSKANLAGLKASLQKSKAPHFEVMELSGLNHLFQQCKKCTVAEYGELEETLSPVLLETIGKWLAKNVK